MATWCIFHGGPSVRERESDSVTGRVRDVGDDAQGTIREGGDEAMTLTTADGHPIELGCHYWLWSSSIGTYDCIQPVEIGGFVCENHPSPSIRYKYRLSGETGSGFNQDADRSLVFWEIRNLADAIESRQGARLNRPMSPKEPTQ